MNGGQWWGIYHFWCHCNYEVHIQCLSIKDMILPKKIAVCGKDSKVRTSFIQKQLSGLRLLLYVIYQQLPTSKWLFWCICHISPNSFIARWIVLRPETECNSGQVEDAQIFWATQKRSWREKFMMTSPLKVCCFSMYAVWSFNSFTTKTFLYNCPLNWQMSYVYMMA